jgi:hypothetical protein
MQTSGNRSITSRPVADRTTKVAGLGLVSSFVFLALAAASCSPGNLPGEFETGGTGATGGGAGGTGGAGGGTGGTGGTGGSPGAMPPAACMNLNLMISSIPDIESKFIASRCGKGPSGSVCHASVFPPRLDSPDMTAMLLVNKVGNLCKSDPYIKKGDAAKSFIMAKIMADGPTVDCPSGPAGGGGAKMPFAPATALTNDERDCLVWYINQKAQ